MKMRDLSLYFEYPVSVPKYKITYWPVPKNACTSLKYAFYKLRIGEDFIPLKFKQKYLYHIHSVFPSRPFKKTQSHATWMKLAVVRNPLDRIVSAYCNRILYHNDLRRHEGELHSRGLALQPDFANFIANLEQYRAISKIIKDHTDPQVVFLGEDASYFNLILNVKQLNQLTEILEIAEFNLPRKQDGGGEYKTEVMANLNNHSKQKIMDFYQKDYQVFGQFF